MTASRPDPLPIETTPDLAEHFNFFVGTLGFVPNSVLTMQRKPKLVKVHFTNRVFGYAAFHPNQNARCAGKR